MKDFAQIVVVHILLPILSVLCLSNKMRILQANIQSVNTSKYFLNQAANQYQPDVIALQEVQAMPKDFEIKGNNLAEKRHKLTKEVVELQFFAKTLQKL